MKKQRWWYYLIMVVLVALMLLVANFRFKSSLPSGNIDIQLVPVVAVALIVAFEWRQGLLAVVIGTILLLICRWLLWPDLVILVVDCVAVIMMLRRHQVPSVTQSRLMAITTGLTQVVVMTVVYLAVGWFYTRQWAGVVSFFGQIFPVALLSGLLYSLLISPLISFVRWLLKVTGNFNQQPPAASDGQGSVEINLSSSKKDGSDDHQQK